MILDYWHSGPAVWVCLHGGSSAQTPPMTLKVKLLFSARRWSGDENRSWDFLAGDSLPSRLCSLAATAETILSWLDAGIPGSSGEITGSGECQHV